MRSCAFLYNRPVIQSLSPFLEDDEEALQLLPSQLTQNGYNVKVATSVAQCLEEAIRFSPHLILSKYILPGIAGSKVIELPRSMSHLKTIPIIVYSQEIMGGEKENAFATGDTDFVTGANEEKIHRLINQYSKKARGRRCFKAGRPLAFL